MSDVQEKHAGSLILSDAHRRLSNIYDREDEIGVIRTSIEKFLAGNVVCLEISGESGVGKSIVKQNVLCDFPSLHMFKSSFRNGSSARPYYMLNHLFEQMIVYLKENRSAAQFSIWLESIEPLTAYLTKDIVSSIPFIRDILTNPINVDKSVVSPSTGRNLIESFYLNFSVELFKELGKNTVIIIDNLQYHENQSLELLCKIINKVEFPVLIMMTGYPGNWNAKIKELLKKSSQKQILNDSIALQNFNLTKVEGFIEFSLEGKVNRLEELSELFFETTLGNPRTILEVERNMIKEGHLYFDEDEGVWNWDLDKNLFKSKMSIVSMFMNKYNSMDRDTQEVLEFCACLGDNISPALVTKLTDFNLDQTSNLLKHFWEEGFIDEEMLPTQQGKSNMGHYYFSSEDVADAIHRSIDHQVCKLHHRKIADFLIKRSAVGVADRDVFEVASHLNLSSGLDVPEDDQILFTMVNTRAAKKSRLLASFKAGYDYINHALHFSKGLSWDKDHEVLTDLYQEAYQLARLNSDSKSAKKYYIKAATHFDKEGLYNLRFNKMILDIQFGLLQDSLDTGLELLKSLNFYVRSKVSVFSVLFEFLRIKGMLRNKTIEQIYKMPAANDDRLTKIYQVIFWMYRASQYVAPTLNGVLALKQLQLTLKYGPNRESWSGFMAYGVIIGAGMNDYEVAFQYSDLGNRIAEKYNNVSGKVIFGKAIYWPFKHPLAETLELYELSKEKQKQEGDYIGAAESTVNESLTYVSLGGRVKDVISKVQENYNYCDSVSALDFKDFQRMLLLNLKYLQSGTLSAEESVELKRIVKSSEFKMIQSVDLIMKIIISFLKLDYDEAERLINEGKKAVGTLTGLYFKTEYTFFEGLIYIAKMKLEGIGPLKKRKMNKIISKFEKWAAAAPENYNHKLCLLKGAKYLVEGKDDESKHELEKALKIAKEQENYLILSYVYRGMESLARNAADTEGEKKYQLLLQETYNEWGIDWKE